MDVVQADTRATMHTFIRQGFRSLRLAARHLERPCAAPSHPQRSLWRREVAAAAAGHGDKGPGAAKAAGWHRQQAAATPPAASAGEGAGELASALDAHLRQLSKEQLAAVTAPLGTVRVVAGPGSGKVGALSLLQAGQASESCFPCPQALRPFSGADTGADGAHCRADS